MVRHLTVEPQSTEPSVSQIEVHFLTKAPLRADAKAVADNLSEGRAGKADYSWHQPVSGESALGRLMMPARRATP